MLLDKFFDYLSSIKKDGVLWLFEMKDLADGASRGMYIWTQDESTIYTKRLSRQKMKRKVFLRFAIVEEYEKEEEEDS